jgi:hypothetical protein
MVTDRMLGMFRGRDRKPKPESGAASSASLPGAAEGDGQPEGGAT